MLRRRVLVLCTAVALLWAFPADILAQTAQPDNRKRSRQERAEIEQIVKLVDGVMAGEPAPTDVTMTLTPFFLKSQEVRTYVPFQLTVNGAPTADSALYVRVVDAAAYAEAKDKRKFEYTWDDIHFVPAAQLGSGTAILHRVFMAPPGTYDVYVALKERLPEKAPRTQVAKAGVFKTAIAVPDFGNGELQTSSVLVTDTVNMLNAPLDMDQARERPFVFGMQELVPAADMDFAKSEELSIFFQVYNAGLDDQGKPNLVLEYNFHRTENGEEKFFNKTNPQTVNASNLPPQFDPAKFPVPGGITVPLATFPEGAYRLEIKISDKASGKTLSRDVKFNVKAS
ncbi:MAG: hypothetical protein AB1635_16590 [Acidobacteriota bacterium]